MRKFYSIVLMATALLIGTTAWAVDVYSWDDLQGAINAADATTETTIVLKADISTAAPIDARGKNLILDLAGFDITSTAGYIIKIADGPTNDNAQRIGGKLSIINSEKATKASTISGAGWAALVQGAYDDVANFAVLKIGEGVRLTTTNNYGIVLKQASYFNKKNQETAYLVGYGIVVEVNGYVQAVKNALWVLGNIQAKTGNIPQVIVGGTGELAGGNDAVCLYGGGYAYYHIEGTVQGGTGIYAKAGEYEITGNAHIIATATEHTEVVPNGNGYTGGMGCGIISDSKAGYAGGMQIEISGNATIQSNTPGGYAIEEVKSDTEHSNTESLVIESGTITGNVSMTAELAEDVKVNGTITGGTFNTDVTEYLSNVTGVITPVDDGNGNTVYVVEEKPNADPWVTDIASATAASYVRLTGSYSAMLAADAQAKYLVMQDNAKIIVPADKKMTVGEVVMGQNTVIEVQAGGKLIITDAQGLVANYASNIVLHASETEQAIFLFNPAVTSNRHPKATVEFISKSFVKTGSTEWARQCFGIPSIGALTDVDTEGNVPTVFGVYNYSTHAWEKVAGINKAPYTEDWSKFANPFDYYQMINYAENPGTKVIMKGALVGNENPQLDVHANAWNGYANSFMGPMNMEKLIEMIPNTVQKAIYLLDLTTSEFRWEPYSLAFMEPEDAINPLQPFLLLNSLAADNIDIDYADAVYYTPAGSGETKPGAAPAPARRAESNMTKAKLIVKGEGCIDRVGVVEGEDFSAEFDNGYDAAKYMNEGFNMYVSADEKMSIFATDDLNNTYVGLQAVKGGNYTIEFAKVQGEELTLIDHETGAQVAMVEGATYEFTAEANSVNDYRFEIVSAAKMPTAIENAEVVKSAKGIYTITGQYVGEMNVWNTLPAGIYVVNGEKLVK